ncbi:MAG: hypothetical protein A2287_10340 [Candidatus Melainabacteria bacterium RIFOXYA12_FULL_32_12]|nr:MAG: hypothetical protein A2255_05585 [Candidatus Melainabacteria bacterium RIFOXYA2_FULL_32_9]OGI29179.1 MAG: hypothetical protein A2287_10340 [Candidatus Melainabacteria bacterium RIFOXYA12_FULL_32_12]
MPAREQVKILLLKRNMTITELASRMTEFTGKKYSRQNLSNKLSKRTLRFEEFEVIAEILGYKIELIDRENSK